MVEEVEKGKEGINPTRYDARILVSKADRQAGTQQKISISSTEEEEEEEEEEEQWSLHKFYNYNLKYLIPVCDYYHF